MGYTVFRRQAGKNQLVVNDGIEKSVDPVHAAAAGNVIEEVVGVVVVQVVERPCPG